MNIVTMNAYTHAIAADSVAVKMPERMPPMMMKTVPSPQNESIATLSDSRKVRISALGMWRFCAVHSTSPTRHRPNRTPGRMPARKRCAIETLPPAAIE